MSNNRGRPVVPLAFSYVVRNGCPAHIFTFVNSVPIWIRIYMILNSSKCMFTLLTHTLNDKASVGAAFSLSWWQRCAQINIKELYTNTNRRANKRSIWCIYGCPERSWLAYAHIHTHTSNCTTQFGGSIIVDPLECAAATSSKYSTFKAVGDIERSLVNYILILTL